LELTMAGSCPHPGVTHAPKVNTVVKAKMIKNRIRITVVAVQSIATR
jgi:hypothetical protein